MRVPISCCYLLAGVLSLVGFSSFGQAPPAPAAPAAASPAATGSLTGTVLDSTSRQAVAYTTVGLLLAAPPDKPITGVAADDEGRFTLTKLTPGQYRVRISFVGYRTVTRAVTVTEGRTDLGTIQLATAGQQLGEVTVEGQKPVVEMKPDRLVYNAEQDITNAGGSAADVLQKAPLLSLDANGNPKLRGSGNVKVLINNKPSSIMATNVAEALKQLPADQIKAVEVITTPSAKYESEGSAGIINIILKKNNLDGINGRVGGAYGNRNSGLNTSLNAHKGKVGAAISVNRSWWNGPNRVTSERVDRGVDSPSRLLQAGDGDYEGGGTWSTLSLDYDPDKHNTVNVSANLNTYSGHSDNNLTNELIAPDQNRLFRRDNRSIWGDNAYDVSGTYTRTFEGQERREWSVIGQYSQSRGKNGYDAKQYNNQRTAGGLPDYSERSVGRSPGHETTVQTDYTHPIGEKQTLEIGAKSIWRTMDSHTTVETAYADGVFTLAPTRSANLDYDQQVTAGYAVYGFALGAKTTARLGARYEYATLTGRPAEQPKFSSTFRNLLPNVSLTYAPKPEFSTTLTYSRRVQRPQIWYLNPFVDRSDSLNVWSGNPRIKPEVTDNLELNFNTTIKSTTLNVSGFARRTSGSIEQYVYKTGNVLNSTFANLASSAAYGGNVYLMVKPTNKWEVSLSPDVTYFVLNSPALGAHNEGLQVSGNLNTSYQLPHGFTVQAFLYKSSNQIQLQGTGTGWQFYQVGLKKKLFKEKADLTLNLNNIFTHSRDFKTTTTTPQFVQESHWFNYQQGYRLAFSYRFGSLQQQNKQRKRVENTDVKSGGSKGQ